MDLFPKKYFIEPINNLINQISNHRTYKDLKTNIVIDTNIKEIKFIFEGFRDINKDSNINNIDSFIKFFVNDFFNFLILFYICYSLSLITQSSKFKFNILFSSESIYSP